MYILIELRRDDLEDINKNAADKSMLDAILDLLIYKL